jgi:hypothetical protein
MFAWRDNYISYNGGGAPPPGGDPYWTSVTMLQNYETPSIMYNDSSSLTNNMFTGGYARPNPRTPFTGATSNSVRIDTDAGGSNIGIVGALYNSAWALGTQSWTAECWGYFNTLSVTGSLSEVMIVNNVGGSYASIRVTVTTSGQVYLLCNGASSGSWINTGTTTAGAITINTWNHFAAVRNGSVFTLYINGVSRLTYNSAASLYNGQLNGLGETYIGNFPPGSSFVGNMNGYITNFRLVVGTAVYTAGFTPSTSPLTNITNTKLLLNMVGYGQTNNQALTDYSIFGSNIVQTNSPRYSGLSPFTNIYPGSYRLNSASLQFLTSPTIANYTYSTSNLTMECWVRFTSVGSTQYIIDQRNSGAATAIIPSIYMDGTTNTIRYFVNGADRITGTTTMTTSTWYHIAVSKSSGSTRLFINGVQDGSTYTDSNTYAACRVVIGSQANTAGNYLNGHITNVRLSKFAYYTTTFTPSTTPLTNDSTYTVYFLLPQTGGIQDLSNSGSLISNGTNTVSTNNPHVQSITKKFGTQSLYYSGSASPYQIVNDSTDLQFGTGDFTIECWVQLGTTTNQSIIGKGTATTGWLLSVTSGAVLTFTIDASVVITGSTSMPTSSTWYFVALSRVSGTFYMFVDGVSQGTYTGVSNFNQTNVMYIGANRTGASPLFGYMDDLRITKGVGRYTSTCPVPTETFPTS